MGQIWCCCGVVWAGGCGSDSTLAWEHPYPAGAGLKRQNKQTNKQTKKNPQKKNKQLEIIALYETEKALSWTRTEKKEEEKKRKKEAKEQKRRRKKKKLEKKKKIKMSKNKK